MDKNKIVIRLRIPKLGIEDDIEVPVSITANNLVVAINTAYNLGMNTNDIENCYLKAENPIALLKGNKSLEEFSLYNGSLIIITV